MSRGTRPTRVVDLLRDLTAAARHEADRPAFMDGLLLGAMVGAAVAGSTVWSRWRARRQPTGSPAGSDDAEARSASPARAAQPPLELAPPD